eukprot:COSAG03_NODE_3377_length_2050_cov_3.098924_3_plen_352_part_00
MRSSTSALRSSAPRWQFTRWARPSTGTGSAARFCLCRCRCRCRCLCLCLSVSLSLCLSVSLPLSLSLSLSLCLSVSLSLCLCLCLSVSSSPSKRRYGIRRPLLACVLLMTAACLGISVASSGPAVALGLFALRLGNKSSELAFKTQVRSPKLTVGCSQSSYMLMVYRVVGTQVNYHYLRARGRAMAVTSLLGNQLGSQVAVPLAANVLCEATDFRATYRVIGISALAFGCTALALARERTRDTPPGPVSEQVSEQVSDVRSSATVAEAWTKRHVLRCPAFWAHVLVVFVAFNMVCSLPLSLCLCLCLCLCLYVSLSHVHRYPTSPNLGVGLDLRRARGGAGDGCGSTCQRR